MKILVTGGAGFIGSHIVDLFLGKGHQVAVVDNLSTGKKENINLKVKFYKVDIRDKASLEKVFAIEKPEVVCHQAAQVAVAKSIQNPSFDSEVNIIGGINLIEVARKHQTKRIIFASSAACYGEPIKLPVMENHHSNPLSFYGLSKLTFEKCLKLAADLYGLEYVIMRYANVYGPRQTAEGEAGVAAIFTSQILAGQKPKIFGKGNKTRDYVYVGDIAQANLLALTTSNTNTTYNLGTGQQTSDQQLFDLISKLADSGIKPEYAADRPGDIQHFYYDSSKAKIKLDWEAKTSLEAGLRKTVKFYQGKRK